MCFVVQYRVRENRLFCHQNKDDGLSGFNIWSSLAVEENHLFCASFAVLPFSIHQAVLYCIVLWCNYNEKRGIFHHVHGEHGGLEVCKLFLFLFLFL